MSNTNSVGDDELFLRNGWPTKGVQLYFQPGPLSKILTIANRWHVASRIWTCVEPDGQNKTPKSIFILVIKLISWDKRQMKNYNDLKKWSHFYICMYITKYITERYSRKNKNNCDVSIYYYLFPIFLLMESFPFPLFSFT